MWPHNPWNDDQHASPKETTQRSRCLRCISFPRAPTQESTMSAFDEDSELLQEALDILARWDFEMSDVTSEEGGSSLFVRSESDSGDGSDGATPQTQRISNAKTPTQVRRREEIIDLRSQVVELEAQLKQLQAAQTWRFDANGHNEAHIAVWKDMASRQQRLRQRAEHEEAKLKIQAQIHVQIARGFVKLVEKAKRANERDRVSTPKRRRQGTDVSQPHASERQLACVERLYQERATAFMHTRFCDNSLKFVDASIGEDMGDYIQVDVCEAWAVPFEWSRALHAVWRYQTMRSAGTVCHTDFNAEAVALEGDVQVSRFTVPAAASSERFHGTIVSKHFASSDVQTAAIITNGVARLHGVSPHWLSTIADTWVRAQPFPANNDLTILQISERFRIYFDPQAGPGSREQARSVSEFLFEQARRNIDLRHEVVETLLLRGHKY